MSTEFPDGPGRLPDYHPPPTQAQDLSQPPAAPHQLSPPLLAGDPDTPTADGRKRRGPYKCSKCSRPGHPVARVGHVCPYKTRKDGARADGPPAYEGVLSFATSAAPPGAVPVVPAAPGQPGLVLPTPPGSGGEQHTFTIDPRFHGSGVTFGAMPYPNASISAGPANGATPSSDSEEGSEYEDARVESVLAGKRKRPAASAGPSSGTREQKRRGSQQQGKDDDYAMHSHEALTHVRQLDPSGQAHAVLLTCRPDGQNPTIYFSPSIAQNQALARKVRASLDDALHVLAAERAAAYDRSLASSLERAERAEQRAEEAVRLAQDVQRRADAQAQRAQEAEERARERAEAAERQAQDMRARFEALMGRLGAGAALPQLAPEGAPEEGV